MKIKAAQFDSISEGKTQCVKLDDHKILLIKQQGQVYAIENRCPHFGLSMEKGPVADGAITCPWHGSRFDIATGANLDWVNSVVGIPVPKWTGKLIAMGKQPQPVRTFPVTVEGNDVFVELA